MLLSVSSRSGLCLAALRSPQHSIRSQRMPSLLLKMPTTSLWKVSQTFSHEPLEPDEFVGDAVLMKNHFSFDGDAAWWK